MAFGVDAVSSSSRIASPAPGATGYERFRAECRVFGRPRSKSIVPRRRATAPRALDPTTLRGLLADRLAAPQHRDGHRRPPTELSEPTTEAPEHARIRASEHEGRCPRCHTATARVRRGARRSYLRGESPQPDLAKEIVGSLPPGQRAPGRHGRPDRNGDTTRRTFRCWSERRYRRRWYRHLASVSRSDAHASLRSPLFVAGALERSGTQDDAAPHPRMNATVDRERSAKQTPGSIRSWFEESYACHKGRGMNHGIYRCDAGRTDHGFDHLSRRGPDLA